MYIYLYMYINGYGSTHEPPPKMDRFRDTSIRSVWLWVHWYGACTQTMTPGLRTRSLLFASIKSTSKAVWVEEVQNITKVLTQGISQKHESTLMLKKVSRF